MQETGNFGYLPEKYCGLESSKVVIIPVPYDGTSTWLKGADKGPTAIIEASANLELYDIETDSEIYREGICTAEAVEGRFHPQDMIEAVAQRVRDYLEMDKFTVAVGGEHLVSVGSVKAHVENHSNITVLQLDAHADLRDEYKGSKYNHACVMARIRELCPIVQVGLRSMDSSEKALLDRRRAFFAEGICGKTDWIDAAVGELSDKVYLTVDLDVYDPAIMPSTGTPEPGGLFWYEVLGLLRRVCRQRDVVGLDVVELCPNERNKAPDFLAAKLIYKVLSYKFRG